MESYKVSIKKSAAKEIEAIQYQDRLRVIEKIRGLSEDPRPLGSQKLSGQEKYRVRKGNYRILYQIYEGELVVEVVKVGHRRAVYRG